MLPRKDANLRLRTIRNVIVKLRFLVFLIAAKAKQIHGKGNKDHNFGDNEKADGEMASPVGRGRFCIREGLVDEPNKKFASGARKKQM